MLEIVTGTIDIYPDVRHSQIMGLLKVPGPHVRITRMPPHAVREGQASHPSSVYSCRGVVDVNKSLSPKPHAISGWANYGFLDWEISHVRFTFT